MISIIAPMLNEIAFVKAWCEFATNISDDVIMVDTGSTDGCIEIVEQYPIKLMHTKIKAKYDWDEGKIRNDLISMARRRWIMQLDIDELFGQEFRDAYNEIVNSKKMFLWFNHYPFWLSPNFIRCNQLQWKKNWWHRFHPTRKFKMFRNLPTIRYMDEKDHAHIEWLGLGKSSPRLSRECFDIPYYHYHYCVQRDCMENRSTELPLSGIKCMTYQGEHPRETRFYDWWR